VALVLLTTPKAGYAEEMSDAGKVVFLLGLVAAVTVYVLIKGKVDEAKHQARMEELHRSFKFASEISLASALSGELVYVEPGSFPIDFDAVRGLVFALVQRCGGRVVENRQSATLVLKAYWWKMERGVYDSKSGGSHTFGGTGRGSDSSYSGSSEIEKVEGAVAVEVWRKGSLALGPAVAVAQGSEILATQSNSSHGSWSSTQKGYSSNRSGMSLGSWTDRDWLYYSLIEKCFSQF